MLCYRILTKLYIVHENNLNVCLRSRWKYLPKIRLRSGHQFVHTNVKNYSTPDNNLSSTEHSTASILPLENIHGHVPVLATEVLEAMSVRENGVYLDMTFGAGGHTRRILESEPSVTVYTLDRDPSTERFSRALQQQFPNRVFPIRGKFSELPNLLAEKEIKANFFDGMLMDLGASSMQFNEPERGFMLSQNGPLDMRMDGAGAVNTPTAADILEFIDEISLYKVLKYYGEEKRARSIARTIVESRIMFKRLKTTKELAQLVVSVTGIERQMDKLQKFAHPATRTFQALRILVNDELNELDHGIRLAHLFLKPNGVLVTISFHSLEDTIVKKHFVGSDLTFVGLSGIGNPASINSQKDHLRTFSQEELLEEVPRPWRAIYKHVVTPSFEEVQRNPRARSAKLRAAYKLPVQPNIYT